MKILPIALLAASLAGCSTMPATVHVPQPAPAPKPHKAIVKAAPALAPVIVPAPQLAPKPPTFKQRFRTTFGKIRWLHPR